MATRTVKNQQVLNQQRKNNSAHAAHFMVHSLLLLHNYDMKNSQCKVQFKKNFTPRKFIHINLTLQVQWKTFNKVQKGKFILIVTLFAASAVIVAKTLFCMEIGRNHKAQCTNSISQINLITLKQQKLCKYTVSRLTSTNLLQELVEIICL